MKPLCLLLLLVFLTPRHSWASLQAYESSARYQYTFQLCQAYRQSTILNKVRVSFEEVTKNFTHGATSALGFRSEDGVQELISSDEYFKALSACFGSFSDNRVKWDSFTLMLIISEAAGKDIAYVGSYTAGGRILKLLSGMTKISYLRPLETYLIENPMVLKSIKMVGVGTLSAWGIKTGYDQIQKMRAIINPNVAQSQINDEVSDEKLPTLDKEYSIIFKKIDEELSRTTSSKKRNELLALRKSAQQQYELDRKSILALKK